MTPEQYEARFEMINRERNLQELELVKEYAFANNTIKVGDIVEDHCSTIMVEKVMFARNGEQVSRTLQLPCCVYEGKELTKKLVPRKDGARRKIWQTNLKKVHNVTT